MRVAIACIIAAFLSLAHASPPLPAQPEGVAWPTQRWPVAPLPPQTDQRAITDALTGVFERHIGPAGHPDHRALLVVHQGQIVLESYAPGFGPHSRFQSWSMAKSLTNAFVGILVKNQQLVLDSPPPVPGWADSDITSRITLRHLMNMTAGLRDDGNSGNVLFAPDARRNNFERSAMVTVETEPGTTWAYSMATSNLLGGIVSEAVGQTRAEVTQWANDELFSKIGAQSFELEFDQTGHFIGGAFCWATARDWARLGYLFLRNGWGGQNRILPEGWVDFTRTVAQAEDNTQYGAQFWITAPGNDVQSEKLDPSLNGFFMNGSQGQVVLMVPDRDLIVIRLGEAHFAKWPEIHELVNKLALAFPKAAS